VSTIEIASPFLEWLRTRRSIRRFRPEPVPEPLVRAVLDAATWAPSAHNRQPWRFAVVSERPAKVRLAEAMGARLRADLSRDGLAAKVIEREVGRSFDRLTAPPILILLCLTMEDMDRYPDPGRQRNEWLMAVQSAALAGGTLLLAAHDLGLGGCWMCAPLFAPQEALNALGLPPSWQPQGLIALGYPAESPSKSRRPPEEVVRFIGAD
jgi:F420 biosynthesis protein FbiB-like protein